VNQPTGAFAPVGRDAVAHLGTRPIPARPYYDPAWFELEREAVFRPSWICVGHVCELPDPGSFVRRELEVQGPDEAKHAVNRQHLHITRAPADA
jgi:hypothetical protein